MLHLGIIEKFIFKQSWHALLEAFFWLLGSALLIIYFAFVTFQARASSQAIEAFSILENTLVQRGKTINNSEPEVFLWQETTDWQLAENVDQTLWSHKRRKEFEVQQSRQSMNEIPIAVLNIPSLNLLVPVFAGADNDILMRGAGWLDRTAAPDEQGNIAIAAHRDSFFRGLKDIQPGDKIVMQTLKGSRSFNVENISIVSPNDVAVLAPTKESQLTLITCYPFYFVGSAPKRYIVQAMED